MADYQRMHSSSAARTWLDPWDRFVELETVRVFAVVAPLASFRRAATPPLHMPPSTVSRRLATLETALKTRLLHRSARIERWQFLHGKRLEEIAVKKRVTANTFALVRLAVVAGQGIGLLPTAVAGRRRGPSTWSTPHRVTSRRRFERRSTF